MTSNVTNGRCARCKGWGKLQVVVCTLRGRFVRYGDEMMCDLCEGKPPASAARAAYYEGKDQTNGNL